MMTTVGCTGVFITRPLFIMDIRIKFGNRIKALRQSKGLSQEALAHLADLNRTYIPSIEKGERNVSIEVIQKLSLAFKMELNELLKGLD